MWIRGLNFRSKEYFRSATEPLKLDIQRNQSNPITVSPRYLEEVGESLGLLNKVQSYLQEVSQLGLQEAWLGLPPHGHNRWDHSVGAANVGFIWLSALDQDKRIARGALRPPLDTPEKIYPVVVLSLILHDYGHVPFSHLFEQVLESINWLPPTADGSEAAILPERLNKLSKSFQNFVAAYREYQVESDDVRKIVSSLILGNYGMPWLQAIVNSPVDADKIDYIRYDSQFLSNAPFGIRARLLLDKVDQWLSDFLSEQEVNHAGLLALHGRSARAALELWEERMYLYDRFYRAPELRVPDRMAFEIVQQYLIRCTMSKPFLGKQASPPDVKSRVTYKLRGFTDRVARQRDQKPVDPVEAKYRSTLEVMLWARKYGGTSHLEFGILKMMKEQLLQHANIDESFKNFLEECWSCLSSLAEGGVELRQLMNNSLVRQPLLVPREQFDKAREVLRPIQHAYCAEALIDIAKMPRVLAAPKRYSVRSLGGEDKNQDIDYQILVPSGPLNSWQPGKRASQPLSDEVVSDLEKKYSYCRIIVICPNAANTARAVYIWDRVRSVLIESGISVHAMEHWPP